jgi:hypothetical protein
MDEALKAELTKVRKMIAGVKPVESSFGFEVGPHQAIPKSMKVEQSGKNHDGSLQVTIVWEGTSKGVEGKTQYDYNNLSTEMGIGLMKGKAHAMGLDLTSGKGKDILLWQAIFDEFCEQNTSVFNIKVTEKEGKPKSVYVTGEAEKEKDGLSGGDSLDELGGEESLGEGVDELEGLGLGEPAPKGGKKK